MTMKSRVVRQAARPRAARRVTLAKTVGETDPDGVFQKRSIPKKASVTLVASGELHAAVVVVAEASDDRVPDVAGVVARVGPGCTPPIAKVGTAVWGLLNSAIDPCPTKWPGSASCLAAGAWADYAVASEDELSV